MKIDVLGTHTTDHVEQGNNAPVTFMVHGLGQEDRGGDAKTGLFVHFAAHGVFNGLAVLDRPAEPRAAVGIRDLRLIVAVVEEQAAVLGHDQQHRRALHRPQVRIR
jgi:hypothetical protein